MRFAEPWWLLGALTAVVLAAVLIGASVRRLQAVRRFGQEALLSNLVTTDAAARRLLKGVLQVLALAVAFAALAQPQYGWGTRRIPATNLDVVVALDFSKSMYARDVAPSRIERAKSEVARLIADLPGARFGAVAFAGEPLSFPLTSDGPAIAQFFRQLSPHDMPVGGTAIARALESGRALLERDPQSSKHRRVLLLVTDGEDLEGDPVRVAKSAATDGLSIFVVQIGGRTAEPIPDVDETGQMLGYRRDDQGRILTTALSAAGEAQLSQIAELTGGAIVRSADGATGIEAIAERLKLMMTEELSERVETVYADVYAYPLAIAVALWVIEALLLEGGKRRDPKRFVGASWLSGSGAGGLALVVVGALFGGSACQSRVLDQLFTRRAPPVERAIVALGGHDAGLAQRELSEYLNLPECQEGQLAVPPAALERPMAAFDLSLALFQIAEKLGGAFGEELPSGPEGQALLAQRSAEVSCAQAVLEGVLANAALEPMLRAKALVTSGNLEYLRGEFAAAVSLYDRALVLVPGAEGDSPEAVLGRAAAHNRALALRREQEKPPEPPADAGPPPSDAGGEPQSDPSGQPQPDQKPKDKQDGDQGPPEDQPPKDEEGKGPKEQPPKQDSPQAPPEEQRSEAQQPTEEQPPAPRSSQDDRVLDQLEQAPMLQQQDARARRGRQRLGVEDK